MLRLIRTDAGHEDFRYLVQFLDQELKELDGEDHAFYALLNKIDHIRHVIVAYQDDVPVGCGAFRPYDDSSAEIKRMFVSPEQRGKGIAGHVLQELEGWAAASGYQHCVLETGKAQPAAIALYKKSGYVVIPNYGQYEGIDNSVCMRKAL